MLNSILLVPKSETPQFLCKIALNIHDLKFKYRVSCHCSIKNTSLNNAMFGTSLSRNVLETPFDV